MISFLPRILLFADVDAAGLEAVADSFDFGLLSLDRGLALFLLSTRGGPFGRRGVEVDVDAATGLTGFRDDATCWKPSSSWVESPMVSDKRVMLK